MVIIIIAHNSLKFHWTKVQLQTFKLIFCKFVSKINTWASNVMTTSYIIMMKQHAMIRNRWMAWHLQAGNLHLSWNSAWETSKFNFAVESSGCHGTKGMLQPQSTVMTVSDVRSSTYLLMVMVVVIIHRSKIVSNDEHRKVFKIRSFFKHPVSHILKLLCCMYYKHFLLNLHPTQWRENTSLQINKAILQCYVCIGLVWLMAS